MNEEVTQTNSELTGRRESSPGFYSWLISSIGFIVLTQVVRVLVKNSNKKIFYNEKFAFSINIPLAVIYSLYFLVFGFMTYYLIRYWNKLSNLSKLGFGLIISGGVANLAERIYFGYVTDYIFVLNGVLNLADIYIFLGAILVVVSKTNSEKI
ncbi:signal peptidase II [bacterium]|nr:MAG: signal peptidase II [bacterium]